MTKTLWFLETGQIVEPAKLTDGQLHRLMSVATNSCEHLSEMMASRLIQNDPELFANAATEFHAQHASRSRIHQEQTRRRLTGPS